MPTPGPCHVSQHVISLCSWSSIVPRTVSAITRPVQAWHEHLADIIATVMHEHGQSTPRFVALAQRGTAGELFAWRRAR